ncbi:MAG: 16S rRNA (adenine(1518)-N(6)/adenine(1519)-N(6))-dimethyltransferase RsmA [Bacillota bacterium]|nr:16S rRNA (adenine(1518)-N(6)/adenine(1519)-N(6))-dimethyltransferase RsmA [Bacillota bacterium]
MMENIETNPYCSFKAIRDIQNRFGFKFTKSLGQNFIIDSEIPRRIALEAGVDKNTGVIEIGPGIGSLTYELCTNALKVVAIELDKTLLPVLSYTLGKFDNIKILHGDAMKIDLQNIINNEFISYGITDIKFCANLPYYITTPIIMHLLESKLPITSITVMVQKEVAQRLCSNPGGKDCGAITFAVAYFAKAGYLFEVPASSFMPAPKVDSSVVRLSLLNEPPVRPYSAEKMFLIIKSAFLQRRKTLLNALSNSLGMPRENIVSAIEHLGLPPDIRGERLTLHDYANLSDVLYKNS